MGKLTGYVQKPFYYKADQMGIIYHSNYIRRFEEVRVASLAYLGFPYKEIEKSGIIIPVLGVSCNYKEMIRYGEKVNIHSTIQKYTGTWLDFSYGIVGTEDEELKTTDSSKHCFLPSDPQ